MGRLRYPVDKVFSVDDRIPTVDETHLGAALRHRRDLLLKFCARPKIVGVDRRDQVASGLRYASVPRCGDPPVDLRNEPNAIIGSSMTRDDTRRLVQGSVVDDQDLNVAIGLRPYTFQTLV